MDLKPGMLARIHPSCKLSDESFKRHFDHDKSSTFVVLDAGCNVVKIRAVNGTKAEWLYSTSIIPIRKIQTKRRQYATNT
jgi:hypothetical protein